MIKIDFKLDKDYFFNEFRYKKPYIFKSAISELDCINWKYINEVYSRANIEHKSFKLMNGYEVNKEEYIESYVNVGIVEYRFIQSSLYNYLRDGATLVHNRIHNEPIIDHISKQIANFAEAQTITSGYAAFSSKSSYKSHWDTRDVFAVQLIGKKRWIIKTPNFPDPLYMQQTKHFNDIQEPTETYMDIILEAGDILYIPRGWWHNPLPQDGETFHLAIGTFAPTGFEYIRWLNNIIPSILDCRKNLTNFTDDKETLKNISQEISNLITDKMCYESFMMSNLDNHHTPSTLSLDVLGNGKINKLDKNQRIYLNANLIYNFDDGFVIINGNKVNTDDISLKLIQYIFDHPDCSIIDVENHFHKISSDKINNLLFQLSLEGILGLLS